MNKVLLIGRMTRDPEMRSLASGKNVTTFTIATTEYGGEGKEKAEYHPIVAWVRRPHGRTRVAGTANGLGGGARPRPRAPGQSVRARCRPSAPTLVADPPRVRLDA